MENASKALLMAGGILIAMVTISIFVLMFSQVGQAVNLTEEDTQITEITDFNNSFSAYNKKLMYGVDVISVLNKAIDNNKRYKVQRDYTNEYYMNITIILQSDLQILEETYTKNGIRYEKESSNETTLMSSGVQYSLNNSNDYDALQVLLIDVDPSRITR